MSPRDPSAPRLAHPLLALLVGLGAAAVPAWSLDLGHFVREVPNALFSPWGALVALWEEDTVTPPAPDQGVAPIPGPGTGGGSNDAGVIIDPNGTPRL